MMCSNEMEKSKAVSDAAFLDYLKTRQNRYKFRAAMIQVLNILAEVDGIQPIPTKKSKNSEQRRR